MNDTFVVGRCLWLGSHGRFLGGFLSRAEVRDVLNALTSMPPERPADCAPHGRQRLLGVRRLDRLRSHTTFVVAIRVRMQAGL